MLKIEDILREDFDWENADGSPKLNNPETLPRIQC